jgi:hypothetical protein
MLTRDEIQQLLALQSRAYGLLMWLADESTKDPHLLSPAAVAALQEPGTAAEWLDRNRQRVPEALVSYEALQPFAALLASFFSTSFQVRHFEFEGRLIESRVTVGADTASSTHGGLEQCRALALRHLASTEKLPLLEKEARALVRRKSLSEASLLWTYVWELDRRAKQKGKGAVVHRIWKAIPRDVRKSLDVDRIWNAREQLLQAVTAHLDDPGG